MSTNMDLPSVAVVGAGAVGCFFGGMLARAGAAVTLIGRANHVEAWRRDGLVIESAKFPAQLRVNASTSLDAAAGADLVLLCVKTLDLESTARELAPMLTPAASVVCMQNGVEHGERFRAAAGRGGITCVVNIGAAMSGPGRVKHNGRGDLAIGAAPADELARVAQWFEHAEVPCRISANIEGELWSKLILNCAYNAQSALTQARYGILARNPGTRAVLTAAVGECIAVARAAGVTLAVADPLAAALALGDSMGETTSSTAQDIARGKLTEVDSLNGYIVRRGAEFGIPTPVNQTLHALVKVLEVTPRPAGG